MGLIRHTGDQGSRYDQDISGYGCRIINLEYSDFRCMDIARIHIF